LVVLLLFMASMNPTTPAAGVKPVDQSCRRY